MGDSLDLLLPELGALGYCQPDGTFITTLEQLRQWLAEMVAAGEAAVVDGLATRVQRPRSWANQKVLYDPKRHTHTAQGLSVATIWGDLLWLDGGWPGSCHEHELLALAGLGEVLDEVEVVSLLDRGFRGMAKTRQHWHAPVGGPPQHRPPYRRPAGLQAPAGRAARAGRAVHRASGQRLGTAPLGAGCCTASGTSSGPPACSSALAAGCTESPHDKGITVT